MRQVRRGVTRTGARGFTLVETVVAFGLFLVVAAVAMWSWSAAFAAEARTGARADLSAVVTARIDELALVPVGDLLSGGFVVPDACEGAAAGIEGTSCVTSGGQVATIAYQFSTPGAPAPCPSASADPGEVLAVHGYVQVQACLTSLTSAAFTGQERTGVEGEVPTQSRTVVAEDPGMRVSGRSVAVHLSGVTAELGDRHVFLLDASDPTVVLASAERRGATVRFDLGATSAPLACTPARPCVVGLSAATPHTRTSEPAAGGEFTATLEVSDESGPSAPVVAPEQGTAQVRAHLALTTEPAAAVLP